MIGQTILNRFDESGPPCFGKVGIFANEKSDRRPVF